MLGKMLGISRLLEIIREAIDVTPDDALEFFRWLRDKLTEQIEQWEQQGIQPPSGEPLDPFQPGESDPVTGEPIDGLGR